MKILEVENLVTEFQLTSGTIRAADEVSFSLEKGSVLGIVGESGSGKTVTALSLLRLIDAPGKIADGRILYWDNAPETVPSLPFMVSPEGGASLEIEKKEKEDSSQKKKFPWEMPDAEKEGWAKDLLKLSPSEMLNVRGDKIAMIFQEPMTSLNPLFTVGDQIMEGILAHRFVSRGEARERAMDLLGQVGISDAHRRLNDYPHQMSGGMRQRVMIAMALACEPEILIADEPTTALDVTIQAQILELIQKIIEEKKMTMILITHDLGVVAETCDKVLVMYAGKVVEEAPVDVLFRRPKHPYTIGLLESIPSLGKKQSGPLKMIPGTVPDLLRLPRGCRFVDRCPRASRACGEKLPKLRFKGQGQWARCINT
ncbi:MAG: ABC transporter ATP-binding protein [bacterium]